MFSKTVGRGTPGWASPSRLTLGGERRRELASGDSGRLVNRCDYQFVDDFPPYPASFTGASDSPDDRYVVLVTSTAGEGQPARTVHTAPLGREEARDFMAQIANGQPTDLLFGPINLVAEVEPGRLLVCREGGFLQGDETYDVRVARVLFSSG